MTNKPRISVKPIKWSEHKFRGRPRWTGAGYVIKITPSNVWYIDNPHRAFTDIEPAKAEVFARYSKIILSKVEIIQ